MTTQRRHPRGAVAIFVIVILLVLTLSATAYLQQASSNRRAMISVSGQQLASARAEQAAQQAIADIRSGAVALGTLVPRVAPATAADCATNCVVHPTVDNGSAAELSAGGGLQWDYSIYSLSQLGSPANRYMVLANGYFGLTPTSSHFAQASLEIEVDVGALLSGRSTTDDSSGMMIPF
jgi:hypothetical protein